jgi:hypothetical protein
MQDKAKTSRSAGPPAEDLPYVIEIWSESDRKGVEYALARAASGELARAIFKAATAEHPGRRITVRKGKRIIADTCSEA